MGTALMVENELFIRDATRGFVDDAMNLLDSSYTTTTLLRKYSEPFTPGLIVGSRS